ncbi:MAG TPA: hypothetical protein VMZ53_10130 [Kofleriaceae bacterium]|nr:hypothetical protein [Kofleriaceae bacterium]
MAAPKTWLAIPVVAVASAGAAAALGMRAGAPDWEVAAATGLLAAALAAAVRAFAGPSLAAAVAGVAAALLGTLTVLELPHLVLSRGAIASAAAMFAICELVRPMPPEESPLPSIGAAVLAGVLDPSFVALVPITGWRYVRGPWPRPRGALALPIAGALACILAAVAAVVPSTFLSDVWTAWTQRDGVVHAPLDVIARAGDALGPITAVAAVAGLGVCATRGRLAVVSIGAIVVGALAVDLALGSVGAAVPTIAALGAGVAIARLTAMVRWPAGQTFVGAVAGFMMVLAPALALALR